MPATEKNLSSGQQYMKIKKTLGTSIFILTNLLMASVYAQGLNDAFGCIQQINKRIYGDDIVDLRYCQLRDDDMPSLASFLNSHPKIISLFLNGNDDITSVGYADLLTNNHTIRELHLDDNYFGVSDDTAEVLSKDTNLTYLTVNWCAISAKGAAFLAALPNLDYLEISNNWIEDAGAIAFGKYSHVTYLDVDNNNIGPEGAIGLSQLSSVSTLILSNNYVGDTGAIALAQITHTGSKPMSVLDLTNNHISDKSAEALSKNVPVKGLILEHDDITDAGATFLANNTDNSPKHQLIDLDVSYNHLSQSGIQMLEEKIPYLTAAGNDGDLQSIAHHQSNRIRPKEQSKEIILYCQTKHNNFCKQFNPA